MNTLLAQTNALFISKGFDTMVSHCSDDSGLVWICLSARKWSNGKDNNYWSSLIFSEDGNEMLDDKELSRRKESLMAKTVQS